MNKEDAIKKLKECQNNWDIETAHYEADNVLCNLLSSLGYYDVIKEYVKVDKWFA